MLDEHEIPYRYREYTREPLSIAEIRAVLDALDARPQDVLRTRDAAYRTLALTGGEDDDVLIARMAEHPTLLQRPIGVLDGRAVVGRPPTALLTLVDP